MNSDCFNQTQQASILQTALLAETTLYVGLNLAGTTPTPQNMSFANITEPVGSWYSHMSTTFLDAFVNSNGQIQIDCAPVQWNYTGTAAAQSITGWWVGTVISGTPTTLLSQGVFSTPVLMQQSLNAVTATPTLNFNVVPLGN